jgi:putative Mg2+ transporter-C (MgtC) family protein
MAADAGGVLHALPLIDEPWLRLILAAIAGIILGLPAELTGLPGGVRTHMLVVVGASLYCTTAMFIAREDRVATLRILQGIAGGIGFVGAATVLHQASGGVRGVATAASIFNAAAVGGVIGLGSVRFGVVLAVAIALLNAAGIALERYLRRRPHPRFRRVDDEVPPQQPPSDHAA